eukprot:Hpha_TRINITY_DN19451_c0_g1::TRINITY_DN19451_c0_g1_i1::g.45836::m.45836
MTQDVSGGGIAGESPGKVVVLVICYGVNKGVQMVWRWPARGVGLDISSLPVEFSDKIETTLGVLTEHLSCLLCPQQIQAIPEADVICVEHFSFLVRYFHLSEGNVMHAAIAFGVHSTLAHRVEAYARFLETYQAAVVREENRCGYLRDAALALSRNRDTAESHGSWSELSGSILNASALPSSSVSAVSLVTELQQIAEAFRDQSQLQLRVNDWLSLEADFTPHGNTAPEIADFAESEKWQFIGVSSSLRLPLTSHGDGALCKRVEELIPGLSLQEVVACFATPCSLWSFRDALSRSLRFRQQRGMRNPPTTRTQWDERTAASAGRHAPSRPAPAPAVQLVETSAFRQLVTVLVDSGVAQIRRTYYVMFPHHLELAVRDRYRQGRGGGQQFAVPPAAEPRREPPPPAVVLVPPERSSAGALCFTGAGDTGLQAPTGAVRQAPYPSSDITALITNFLTSGQSGAVKDEVKLNMCRLAGYFNGRWAKEEILAAEPELSATALDEVVYTYRHVVATVYA